MFFKKMQYFDEYRSSVNTGVPFYRESDFCLIIYCYYFAS